VAAKNNLQGPLWIPSLAKVRICAYSLDICKDGLKQPLNLCGPCQGWGSRFRVRLTPAHSKIARAQDSITPGLIGAEINANFPILGKQNRQFHFKSELHTLQTIIIPILTSFQYKCLI
jgi:hypothetical protein